MPGECKNHSKAFACLFFFIVNDGLFEDYVNIPVAHINAIIFICLVVSYYGYRKK